ncbi:MAG: 6-bladed beta-propeller [Bacteroidales bacterium]|nr:6-bladed beta-propeller [Bacteroidales bacterium]
MNKSIIIAIILLVGSCSGRKGSTANETEVDLSVNIDNIETRKLYLSEIAREFRMVLLESSEAALLNNPTEFALNDEYILIVDRDQKPAKLFTTTGEYIRDIGSIGVGPDEYTSVVSPHIDKNDNSIWLQLGGNYSHPKEGWVFVYNNSGELVKKINAFGRSDDQGANRVLIHNNKVIKPGNVDSRNMIVIKTIDNENVIKIKNRIPSDYFTYSTNTSIVYPFDEDYHFKIGESDTIYSLSLEGKVTPVATVFTDRYKFDEAKIREARSSTGPGRFENILAATEGCYSIKLLGETANHYLLSVTINGKAHSTKLLAVDKDSGEAFFFEIINDFRFDITESRRPFIYNNEYIIFHYPAITFIDALRKKIEDTKDMNIIPKLEMLAESIKTDDNDILLIYKMKL